MLSSSPIDASALSRAKSLLDHYVGAVSASTSPSRSPPSGAMVHSNRVANGVAVSASASASSSPASRKSSVARVKHEWWEDRSNSQSSLDEAEEFAEAEEDDDGFVTNEDGDGDDDDIDDEDDRAEGEQSEDFTEDGGSDDDSVLTLSTVEKIGHDVLPELSRMAAQTLVDSPEFVTDNQFSGTEGVAKKAALEEKKETLLLALLDLLCSTDHANGCNRIFPLLVTKLKALGFVSSTSFLRNLEQWRTQNRRFFHHIFASAQLSLMRRSVSEDSVLSPRLSSAGASRQISPSGSPNAKQSSPLVRNDKDTVSTSPANSGTVMRPTVPFSNSKARDQFLAAQEQAHMEHAVNSLVPYASAIPTGSLFFPPTVTAGITVTSPPHDVKANDTFAPAPQRSTITLGKTSTVVHTSSRYRSEFEEISSIGKGGFGRVFHCRHRTDGHEYAVKRVRISFRSARDLERRYSRVIREVQLLARLDHPNIVRYYQAWLEPVGTTDHQHTGASDSKHVARTKAGFKQFVLPSAVKGSNLVESKRSSSKRRSKQKVTLKQDDDELLFEFSDVDFTPSPKGTAGRSPFRDDEDLVLDGHGEDDEDDEEEEDGEEDEDDEDDEEDEDDAERTDGNEDVESETEPIILGSGSEDESPPTAHSAVPIVESPSRFATSLFGSNGSNGVYLSRSVASHVSSDSSQGASLFGTSAPRMLTAASVKHRPASLSVVASPPRGQLSQSLHDSVFMRHYSAAAEMAHASASSGVPADDEMMCLWNNRKGRFEVYLYIQMQFCSTLNLHEYLAREGRTCDGRQCAMIFSQMLSGVQHMHARGIVHRDLKPSNIFLMGESKELFTVRIGDLGLAKRLDEPDVPRPKKCAVQQVDGCDAAGYAYSSETIGTHTYASPEQVSGMLYNEKTDVFSLGVILYELFCPFSTFSERAHMLTQLRDVVSRKQAVEECDLPAQLVRQYPRVATWIRRCLSYKPCDRPSVSEILADPVFSAGFWTPAVMGRVGAASDAVMDASIAMCITSNGSVASVGSNGGGSDRIHALEAKVAEQETIIAQLREQLLAMQRVQSTP